MRHIYLSLQEQLSVADLSYTYVTSTTPVIIARDLSLSTIYPHTRLVKRLRKYTGNTLWFNEPSVVADCSYAGCRRCTVLGHPDEMNARKTK